MTDGPEAGRGRRLPASLLMFVSVIVVGLLAGIVLSYIDARSTERRLGALEEYVEGRGEQRDRENARTNQRINDAICDLLDQLPEGGLLDRPREKYGCGPGIPIGDLTPEEQQQIAGRASPTTPATIPSPPVDAPRPPTGSAAVPGVPRATAAAPPPRPPGAPPSTTPPATAPPVNLEPLTDPLCDIAGICI